MKPLPVRPHQIKTFKPASFPLGDAIAAITRVTGIASAVHTFAALLGVDCGCAKRRSLLNSLSRSPTHSATHSRTGR